MKIRRIESMLPENCEFCYRGNLRGFWEVQGRSDAILICDHCMKQLVKYQDDHSPKEKPKFVQNEALRQMDPIHGIP